MPRLKRKNYRRPIGYVWTHIFQLLTSHDFSFGVKGEGFGHRTVHGGRVDVEAMKVCWEQFRDRILSAWSIERPGTRPFAWWEFDAPELRQRTDGKVHPFDNPERQKKVDEIDTPSYREGAKKVYYGKPGGLMIADDFEAQYESELEYLGRLGLLADGEQGAYDEQADELDELDLLPSDESEWPDHLDICETRGELSRRAMEAAAKAKAWKRALCDRLGVGGEIE